MLIFEVLQYWLFYGVRILQQRTENYTQIVTFALSMVDALLFIHYLTLILLEIRRLRVEFKIRVVRSPDGESRTYHVGRVSIQQAAVDVLQSYYRDFPAYNPYLERLPTSRMLKEKGAGSRAGGGGGGESTFKVYDIEGGLTSGEQINPAAIMAAAARKRDAGHNERFYEEIEWERRVKKRRARLLVAAEEAFTHIRRMHEEKGKKNNCNFFFCLKDFDLVSVLKFRTKVKNFQSKNAEICWFLKYFNLLFVNSGANLKFAGTWRLANS